MILENFQNKNKNKFLIKKGALETKKNQSLVSLWFI